MTALAAFHRSRYLYKARLPSLVSVQQGYCGLGDRLRLSYFSLTKVWGKRALSPSEETRTLRHYGNHLTQLKPLSS